MTTEYPPEAPTSDMVQLPVHVDLANTGAPTAILLVLAITFIIAGLVVIFCRSKD